MKRTINKLLQDGPIPKSIRNESLKNILRLIHNFGYTDIEDYTVEGLLNNPSKSVKEIQKMLKISQRAAYDYYTTLLYIFYKNEMMEELLKPINELKLRAKIQENNHKK